MSDRNALFARRQRRTRYALRQAGGGRPRLSVFRSGKHIYAQVIDDSVGKTLISASTMDKSFEKASSNVESAQKVGQLLAERAKGSNISAVVFDRGGHLYHGKVKALADAAREAGLQF